MKLLTTRWRLMSNAMPITRLVLRTESGNLTFVCNVGEASKFTFTEALDILRNADTVIGLYAVLANSYLVAHGVDV